MSTNNICTPQIRNPNVGANGWCKGCMHVTRSNLVEPLTEKKMSPDRKNVNHEAQTKKKDIKQKIRLVLHSQTLILSRGKYFCFRPNWSIFCQQVCPCFFIKDSYKMMIEIKASNCDSWGTVSCFFCCDCFHLSMLSQQRLTN